MTAYEMRISDWSSDVCSSDLRVRLEINLRHAKAAALLLALVNHVDEQMEQRQYILPLQISPAFGLFHQQRQLLDGERGRVGVNGGDRSGVAAVDVAKIEESRAIAQFLQQDAIEIGRASCRERVCQYV